MSQFNVKLTGALRPGVEHAAAMAGLARLFKIEPAQAAAVFAKAPVVIKKNVDAAVGEKYCTALGQAGLVCELEAVNGEPVALRKATPPAQPAPPTPSEPAPAPAASPPATAGNATPDIVKTAGEPGFDFRIEARPDFAFLTARIPAGETLKVEASAMATMDTNLRMKTKMRGGLGRFLTSESLFINEFTAEGGPAEIGIAPAAPGDMGHVYLNGDTVFLQNSAFVAAGMNVTVETKWQGFVKGFFSGEGLFLIRCSGNGDLWFNTYGAMIALDVDGDYVVDTSNIVAFTDGLDYKITKVGGYKSLFFSGEGFVCRFTGQGKVWLQTRGVNAFASWANPFRPGKG